jgi:hypothetical protein
MLPRTLLLLVTNFAAADASTAPSIETSSGNGLRFLADDFTFVRGSSSDSISTIVEDIAALRKGTTSNQNRVTVLESTVKAMAASAEAEHIATDQAVSGLNSSVAEVAEVAAMNSQALEAHQRMIERLMTGQTDNTAEIEQLGAKLKTGLVEIGTIVEGLGTESAETKERLEASVTELSALLEKIRHPTTAVVHGSWVVGDDKETAASCPQGRGLRPSACTIEWLGDRIRSADGILITGDKCSAFAANAGGTIRVRLECSDLHKRSQVVTDKDYRDPIRNGQPHTIKCPDGMRALQCHCFSPWNICGQSAFGFSPATIDTCEFSRGAGRRRLSTICVNNS